MAAGDGRNPPKLEAFKNTDEAQNIIVNADNENSNNIPHHIHQQPPPAVGRDINNQNVVHDINNQNLVLAAVPINNANVNAHVHQLQSVNYQVNDDDEHYFASLPPGYRFCPLDIELIVHYLYRKVYNLRLPRNQIREVNLYAQGPDCITARNPSIGENQWYFFTPREKKYQNGNRPNRAAGNGYWKATGADKNIYEDVNTGAEGGVIGLRKALVYYEGKPPKGVKTNWIMHEFKLKEIEDAQKTNKKRSNDMMLDAFVLCKIYKKIDKSDKSGKVDGKDSSSDGKEEESPAQTFENENGAAFGHHQNAHQVATLSAPFNPHSGMYHESKPTFDSGNSLTHLCPSHSYDEDNGSYYLPNVLPSHQPYHYPSMPFPYQTSTAYPPLEPNLPNLSTFQYQQQPRPYRHQQLQQQHHYPPQASSSQYLPFQQLQQQHHYPPQASSSQYLPFHYHPDVSLPVGAQDHQGIFDATRQQMLDDIPDMKAEGLDFPYDFEDVSASDDYLVSDFKPESPSDDKKKS